MRSHRLLAAAIAAAVVAVLAGGTDLAYTSVKSNVDQLQTKLTADLQAGQRELEAGKAMLGQANKAHDASFARSANDHFNAARSQFEAAGQLADKSQLLRNLEFVPSVGDIARSRHSAVRGVAGMGIAIADAGKELADLDSRLIQPPAAGGGGRTLLTALDQTHTSLATVKSALKRAQEAAASVSIHVLPDSQQATFVNARLTINTALEGLDEFERLYPVLKDVLGGNGARNYLIEQVNPAELRPGGGFIGTYSLIRAEQGSLSVIRSGNAYTALADPRPAPGQPGFIPLQDPMRDVIPWVSWSFIDTNIYPDFPSNAMAAERFAQPRLGMNIDAVISIDYYAVAKMLELTGPLEVPGYGRTVDANNFIPQVIQLDFTKGAEHKAILGVIAGPLMERISALPADRWPSLIADLNSLAAERHIQAYFNNQDVEKEIDRVGWSGTFNPTGSQEYMMAVESNIGGGKVNYFLGRYYVVTLTRNGNVLHHRVEVNLVNNQPARSDDFAVDYRAYGSLYAGEAVSSPSNNLRPARYGKPPPPPGAALLEGWLPDVQCCGSKGQAVFEYNTPWPPDAKGSHEIYWQKQPGTITDSIQVIWNDGFGHSYSINGDIGQDRVITLTARGVTLTSGHPAQATLPSLGLG